MKRTIFWLFILLFPLFAQAQVSYGYFSYERVLKSMHGYDMVKKNLEDLQKQYDAELKRAEDDFNKKYEEFLEGQKDFAPTILQKRQSELQELMNRNIAFKAEAERLMKQATDEAMAPLHNSLKEAVSRIGEQEGYAFVLNTDEGSFTYLNPAMGHDINEKLLEELE